MTSPGNGSSQVRELNQSSDQPPSGPAGVTWYLDRVLCISPKWTGFAASLGRVYKTDYRPGWEKISAQGGGWLRRSQ